MPEMTRTQFMAALRRNRWEWISPGCYSPIGSSTTYIDIDRRLIFNGASRPCWKVWAEAGRVPGRDYVAVESEVALLGAIDAETRVL